MNDPLPEVTGGGAAGHSMVTRCEHVFGILVLKFSIDNFDLVCDPCEFRISILSAAICSCDLDGCNSV